MRLIDADAYSAEMKDRQEAAWKWRNEAIAEEDEVKLARAEGAYAAFTEAKLTMDKHIINPWHRVEEELPKDRETVLIYCENTGGIVKSHYHEFIGSGGKKHYWFSGGTYYPKYWMPLPEPPKEDA